MAFFSVSHVAIRGIAGCVPKGVEENSTLPFYVPGEAEQVIAATGIKRKHIAPPGTTAADLCTTAAERLISELRWERESIDLLAFCTQMPDFITSPNSFIVHKALGLPESTVCIDYYHGCPGWVVSLSSVVSLIQTGQIKRAILLDGDTASQAYGVNDREGRLLFGDAGVATALEYSEAAAPICFNIGTLSEGGSALARPHGGFRSPWTIETLQEHLDRLSGKITSEEYTSEMDSLDIFAFAISKAPKAIKKLCSRFSINPEEVDNLVLHQANKLIIDNIVKRVKMPQARVPLSLPNYGNTTSASIPLSMVAELADQLTSVRQRNVVCAFGTGLSYAAAYIETERLVCPPIAEI